MAKRGKKTSCFLFLLVICLMTVGSSLWSQEKDPGDLNPGTVSSEIDPEEKDPKDEPEKKKGFNANIDASLLYGLYNNIFSTISLIQNHEKFAYQLNSEFKRSNDFGFKNSSFYDNEIGFTGKARFFKSWTLIPELKVYNESHGMFDDQVFSREEKDKIVVLFKNEYKPTPARWQFNIGGAQYVQRLAGDDPLSFSCYKLNEEVKWEYIWSASNSVIINHYSWHYFYNDGTSNFDSHVANEILLNFKVTEYVKLNGGAIIDWNYDAGIFPSGKIQVSSTSLKYFAIEGNYSYTLNPFKPEKIFFDQKYVEPTDVLPAAKVHTASLDTSFDISFKKKTSFYLKKFKMKFEGAWERSNNFYNFIPSVNYADSGILAVDAIPVSSLNAKPSILFEFSIFDRSLKLNAGYEYFYYFTSTRVTYRPSHSVSGEVSFKTDRWEFTWENSYQGDVYTDPATDERLGWRILGNFEIQYKIIDTLYLSVKIENMYDNTYYLTKGFNEPGITALGGLRIII